MKSNVFLIALVVVLAAVLLWQNLQNSGEAIRGEQANETSDVEAPGSVAVEPVAPEPVAIEPLIDSSLTTEDENDVAESEAPAAEATDPAADVPEIEAVALEAEPPPAEPVPVQPEIEDPPAEPVTVQPEPGGSAVAGSPHGTKLGGMLYFYRIRFDGPGWNDNAAGIAPLMQEVLKVGVVQKVSGASQNITLTDLPRHKDQYMPALIYMTGTGHIRASDQEIMNLREYLLSGGMLFADLSGGDFHQHFVGFMRRVMREHELKPIEFNHEIFRGQGMPYAMLRGCPIYHNHPGSGPALGITIGDRLAVFYSRGDIGLGWQASGLTVARRPEVEQCFRMGANIVAYSQRNHAASK